MDDFSKYPKSINELKDNDSAAEWTPREAVISVLRKIDSGELDPNALVVVSITRKPNNVTNTDYTCASPNAATTLGMLEVAKYKLLKDGEA